MFLTTKNGAIPIAWSEEHSIPVQGTRGDSFLGLGYVSSQGNRVSRVSPEHAMPCAGVLLHGKFCQRRL